MHCSQYQHRLPLFVLSVISMYYTSNGSLSDHEWSNGALTILFGGMLSETVLS